MDNETLTSEGKYELAGEIFFYDPAVEYQYFSQRMKQISSYNNKFFIEQAKCKLIDRYIKGLASLDDEYETRALADVYRDCLIQLGVDDYALDDCVSDYRQTHVTTANIKISKKGKKQSI